MKLAHYRLRLAVVLGAALVLAAACSKKSSEKGEEASEEAAPVDPEAPAIVIAMIDAHGGMPAWRTAKTVSFESEFSGPGDSAAIVNRVMVDRERKRAYVDFPGSGESAAFDGKRAWGIHWTQPYSPRFAAMFEYDFVVLPWLTMDSGVRLSSAGKDSLWGEEYPVVKMSFVPDSGTRRETYRLFIDPGTKRLKACEYTDAFSPPDSTGSIVPHVIVYEDFTRVEGLLVPTRYTIYRMDHSPVGTATLRDWSFSKPFDEARMTMPDSARADQSTP